MVQKKKKPFIDLTAIPFSTCSHAEYKILNVKMCNARLRRGTECKTSFKIAYHPEEEIQRILHKFMVVTHEKSWTMFEVLLNDEYVRIEDKIKDASLFPLDGHSTLVVKAADTLYTLRNILHDY